MADSNSNSNRGFGAMDKSKQRKIASAGGKTSRSATSHSSSSRASGAAGSTEAAKRGGHNSHHTG
jgi:general stress protein YciG